MTVICELTVINLKIFNIENKKKPIYTIGLKYISLVHVN